MKKRLVRKRILAFGMMVCMLFSMMPTIARADEFAPGELLLNVLKSGESGYTASAFSYSVNGGGTQSFEPDTEADPMSMFAVGDISEEGEITITFNKANPEDPFSHFAYTMGEDMWYFTNEGDLPDGDSYDEELNTLTIGSRTGNEGIQVDAYINPPVILDTTEGEVSITEGAECDGGFINGNSLTITNNAILEIFGELRVENGGTVTVDSGATLIVHGELILAGGELRVEGELVIDRALMMDNCDGSATNRLRGMDLYDNAEDDEMMQKSEGAYFFEDFDAFIYDSEWNKWVRLKNNLFVDSEACTITEEFIGYDNVYVNNQILTVASGSILEVYGELSVENGGTLAIEEGAELIIFGELRLMNGELSVNGNLVAEGAARLIMDNGDSAVNRVSGIAFYDNAEATDPLVNNEGVYTFDQAEAFVFDNRPGVMKWVRQGGGDPGEPGDPGNPGGPSGPNYTKLQKFLEEDWGVATDANVDTMKTAFIDMLWDGLIHECDGEEIYGNKDTFISKVVVGNTAAGTEIVSGQNVSYYDVTITVPRPEDDAITVNTKMYALPTNYIMLEYIEDNTKTNMLWDYTTVADAFSVGDLIAPGTDPNHYFCVGARISGRDGKTNVCFLQMEGGILKNYGMKNVRIFHSDYQGVKFDITDGKIAAQWAYFDHPYVDFGNTSVTNPEKVISFYGNSTLQLNNPHVAGTAGFGLVIDNVSIVSSSGIPANVITFDAVGGTVTFHTDYYTEVPLKVDYHLAGEENQTAYVTVERTGIHTNGWRRGGDKADNSTDTVFHGSEPGGEFNWGTDRYALFSTYYADGYDYDGYTASMYVKLTFADGSTETKIVPGHFFDGEGKVDSFDFKIYMGDAEGAPTHIEVIAYIEAADGSCSSAFTDAWDNTNE